MAPPGIFSCAASRVARGGGGVGGRPSLAAKEEGASPRRRLPGDSQPPAPKPSPPRRRLTGAHGSSTTAGASAGASRSLNTTLTSKEDHHRDRDHRGDRDPNRRPSSSTPASLSAGSTASIDSFVPVFGGLEDDGGGGADGPSWLRPEKNGAPSRFSSSSPPDPYLSDRRRPSWARDADAPLLSPLSSAQPEGAAAGGGAPAAAAPRGTAAAASFSRLAEDGGLAFRIRQERIGRALGSLDPLEPRRVDGSGDEDEDDASGSSHSGFPSPADFQSSFFTAESLQGEDVEGEGPAGGEDDSDLDSSPSPTPPGAQRRGGGTRGRPPRYLGGIPAPVVRRIEQQQQQQQRREEDRRRREEARSDRGLWADEDHGEGASAESPSRTDGDEAARLSLSSSSPRTADADAAGVAIRSAPSQSDSERDRRAIQSVLYCRGIVRLRSEASPDWTVGSAAAAAAAARSPLPSLAAARAHLSLGEALLGVHDYPEACKSFQSAYRIFSAHAAGQRDGERRHALSLALCMERMGTATAMLAASAPQDADAGSPSSFSSSSSSSLLVRSYTVHLEAFRLRCLHLGPHHVDAVASLNMIAKLHALNNDWAEAQRCLWQVYWARARAFGELHPSCAVSAHDVANVFCHLGLWEDASNFYSVASHAYDTLELPATNPAVRKLRRDMERLERLQQRHVYNDALR